MAGIGIFGGTFNPPHMGHLKLVRAFADRLSLSEVIVMPTYIPPHKEVDDLASFEDRYNMCRILFGSDDRFTVSREEYERGGKSYTVDTLTMLKDRYPDEKLYLIMGSDMLSSFDKWYRHEDILKMCTLCAASRRGEEKLGYLFGALIEEFEPYEISSTEIRNKVKNGESISADVGAEVEKYIIGRGLYMDRDSEYMKLIGKLLTPYRFDHSVNVAKSAKLLAEKYGEDPAKAYTAGLLHDIMKDSEKNIQLQIIEESDIILSQYELYNPKLLHAIAGAAYMKLRLGINDVDMLNAVRYHTTGRTSMSLLEKIIYVADYISDDRQYNGIDKMRALAGVSLDDAMLFGLEFTISDLAIKNRIIHPDSVGCYNEIIINKTKKKGKQ
ncbi:MAG: nicotinate (nicotinamide) nucleotide adenylyltransferase [Clostridiales bacterium]|nr:nicotinate (nicotinamide) nucleotide adenylyltransferase [Clostridiales bacterium]